MATARSTDNELLQLTLSKDEAEWLKEQVQNPLHTEDPNEEAYEDEEMRRRFWEVLT